MHYLWKPGGYMTIITLSLHENDRFHWFCVKSVEIRSFFWSECGKIRTRKKSVFGHFSRSEYSIMLDWFDSLVGKTNCRVTVNLEFFTITLVACLPPTMFFTFKYLKFPWQIQKKMFCKIVVLKHLPKFTGKHQCRSPCFIRIAD